MNDGLGLSMEVVICDGVLIDCVSMNKFDLLFVIMSLINYKYVLMNLFVLSFVHCNSSCNLKCRQMLCIKVTKFILNMFIS